MFASQEKLSGAAYSLSTMNCMWIWVGQQLCLYPEEETKRRSSLTTPQWPIMHTILKSVIRDQFMARHRANHVSVAYAPSAIKADKVLAAKAAMFARLGIKVHLCGA